MLNSLDALILVFIGLTVAGLLAILLMFLLKNPTAKKIAFYFSAALGMILAILKALSTPYSHLSETILGWGFGLLSIVALLITVLGKSESKFKLAQLLVTISVIAGMILTFII